MNFYEGGNSMTRTDLRVLTIKGGSAICEMENGREVKVDFQNIPFEVEIGDIFEANVYFTEENEIESIIATQKY